MIDGLQRRLTVGAEIQSAGGVHFRVWAPSRKKVSVILEAGPGAGNAEHLTREKDGHFSGLARTAGAGSQYRYRLDDSDSFPDPASRFQPDGPHGPSEVIDPHSFAWTDRNWKGCGLHGQIIYELHIGTFTAEGNWKSATRELTSLANLGITVIEVMPVADFPGRFGWGYDGVDLFAPTRLYGRPDDFRSFVNQAHSLGMGVILDVVYNHIGPDGNYLKQFTKEYFTDRYKNEWGEALNFDGDEAGPVREFFSDNAGYWIDEYHLDGLRLDATQQIFDSSPEHILQRIGSRVREKAQGRDTILVAENEEQQARLVKPIDEKGYGLDMLWNDDYHHSAMVVLSSHREAYYTDYLGTPQEFVSAAKWGYIYQGQIYKWQKKRRGSPTMGLDPAAFVNFLQNHDQIANSEAGLRCHVFAAPGQYRALTALTILMPGTPMLFQGDEFAASAPFLYFADHNPELAPLVSKGRKAFLAQFPSIALPDRQSSLAEPSDPMTYERCKLDLSERDRHPQTYALYCDLIRLKRHDPVLRSPQRGQFDGAVLGADAFLLRYFSDADGDRLLIVNLGRDLHQDPAPEPLLAPPVNKSWHVLWSSENPRYGGMGVLHPDTDDNWRLMGHSATLLIAR